jgi:hypothetical protein
LAQNLLYQKPPGVFFRVTYKRGGYMVFKEKDNWYYTDETGRQSKPYNNFVDAKTAENKLCLYLQEERIKDTVKEITELLNEKHDREEMLEVFNRLDDVFDYRNWDN